VPHVARALVGADYRWIVPYSIVLGALVLLAGDVLGRVVVRPAELEVGIVTAVVGAPFFVWLVRRRRLAEL
jgi:iron complex transport system permease protein